MTPNSENGFIKFLDEYKSNPNYYSSITEISWPKNKNGEKDITKEPLIENPFKMFSLDDICKDCSKFDNDNIPTTTDALWYKKEENNLTLYFIEFKWHNLDRKKDPKIMEETFLTLERHDAITSDMVDKFKKLYKSYADEDVSFKLRLKPFESIFIVLPSLYEDYCDNNPVDVIDLHNLLKNCEIKVFSFVSTYTKLEDEKNKEINKGMRIVIDQSKKSKRNKSKGRMSYNRTIGPKGSIGATVRKQYKRLELTSLVDFADIFEKSSFDSFLITEGLIN